MNPNHQYNTFMKVAFILVVAMSLSVDVWAETTAQQKKFFERSHVLWFDGIDDVVTVGEFKSLYENTVEVWLRPTSSKAGSIFANGGGPRAVCGSGVHMEVSTQEYCYDVNPDRCGTGNKICTPAPVEYQGVHIAGTYDGYSEKIYVNGVMGNSVDGVSFDSVDWLTIGNLRFYNGYNHPYSGELLEVRVWDHARSQEQITQSMFTRLNGNEEGLVAYWVFDQGKGQIIEDRTGNGYTAMLGKSIQADYQDPNWIEYQSNDSGFKSIFNPDLMNLRF